MPMHRAAHNEVLLPTTSRPWRMILLTVAVLAATAVGAAPALAASTTTVLTATPNPGKPGEPVTLVATVTGEKFKTSGAQGTISVGTSHACAVTAGGGLACWGLNNRGQIGDGTKTNRDIPAVVMDGTAPLAGVSGVSVGFQHTCAVLSNGTAKCWGWNSDGQIGNGASGQEVSSPVPVMLGPSALQGIVSIEAGNYHTCALMTDTTVKCWGINDFGQLANASFSDSPSPVSVVDGSNGSVLGGVTSISSSSEHVCARIGVSGTIRCWGANYYGQLGDGTKSDRNVATAVKNAGGTLTGATTVTAGELHTCARMATSSVTCWGANFSGNLGDGTYDERLTAVTVMEAGSPFVGAVTVSTGSFFTCATITGGGAKCWGSGGVGELGIGQTIANTPSPLPVKANPLTGAPLIGGLVTVDSGSDASCAINSQGAALCWGEDDDNVLGNSTGGDALAPVPVYSLLTGTVLFKSGSSALGLPVAVTAGKSSLTTSRPGGTSELTAVYGGATGFFASTSVPVIYAVSGAPTNDKFVGGAGDDDYDGGGGNDMMEGGSGNDTLNGGTGADMMSGNAGDDTYYVDDPGDQVVEEPNEGTDTVLASIDYTLPDNVENLALVANSYGRIGVGNDLNNEVYGSFSDDQLSGLAGDDLMIGGIGNDTLLGGPGNDILWGEDEGDPAGDDLLDGGSGADKLDGGPGDDTYVVDDPGDTVFEAPDAGVDTVRSSVAFVLTADVENLMLTGSGAIAGTGNDLANVLTGNAGANALAGGGGNDLLSGDAGNDTLSGDDGDDLLSGGDGDDVVSGGAGDDTIEGGPGKDTLDGGPGVDTLSFAGSARGVKADLRRKSADGDAIAGFENLTGSAHDDRLTGSNGANVIDGGDGDDVIAGRKGRDRLTGGKGADRFRFFGPADSPRRKPDVILDFHPKGKHRDVIDLSRYDGKARQKGRQRFTRYLGGRKFTRHPGELRFSRGALLGDLDGNGRVDFKVVLNGVKKLPKKAVKLR